MMKNKIGVIAGDLFWSSIPYDSLNVQLAFSRETNADIIMFDKDIRLNKKFTGEEKFSFDKNHFTDNKNLVVIKNWDDLTKLSRNYDFLVSSAKIAPKTRYPHDIFKNLNCPIGAWDVGGADVLTYAKTYNFYLLKGEIWKNWLQNINPTGMSYVTGTPHYDYYYDDFSGYGKPLNQDKFYQKYSLDPNKKKILIAPSNPSSHVSQFCDNLSNLEKLVKIAQQADIELLVKTYPHDYVLRENDSNYTGIYKRHSKIAGEKTQYEFISTTFPYIKVLESQDHFASLKNVDLVFNMSGSHVSWETFLTKSISFSMNYSNQAYFNRPKYLPEFVKFPDDVINIEIDDIEKIDTLNPDSIDKHAMSKWILNTKFENSTKSLIADLSNYLK